MFLLLIDDSTRYTSIYLLQHKSDAVEAIIDNDRKINNKTGRHRQIRRSDNGGEFIKQTLSESTTKNGILHQTSTSYSPEQNGPVDRQTRTVLEGVSTLLLDSQLPWAFQGYAARTFIYLKNRSPHTALDRSTPYEQWFQKLPDLTNVRVFGFPCYVYIPSEVRKLGGKETNSYLKPTK